MASLGDAWDETRGFVSAGQTLYQLNYNLSSGCSLIVSQEDSLEDGSFEDSWKRALQGEFRG